VRKVRNLLVIKAVIKVVIKVVRKLLRRNNCQVLSASKSPKTISV